MCYLYRNNKNNKNNKNNNNKQVFYLIDRNARGKNAILYTTPVPYLDVAKYSHLMQ